MYTWCEKHREHGWKDDKSLKSKKGGGVNPLKRNIFITQIETCYEKVKNIRG